MMKNNWFATCAAGALMMLANSAWSSDLYYAKSLYRNIWVYEEDGLRCMKFGRNSPGRQSCVQNSDHDHLVFRYTKMMMGSLYFNPNPKHILIIGLGGGTLPGALQKLFPSSEVDVAEIDPVVTDVAQRFFYFTPSSKTHVYEDDGRVFVKRALKQKAKYDLVMLDAFDHEYIPEHMLTKEFLQEVRGLLSDKGVLAANTFSSSRLMDHESATYFNVFGNFYRMGGLPDMAEISKNAAMLEARLHPLGAEKDELLPLLAIESGWPADTRILTDQFSPSNLLNAKRD
jgi:spermidine synthase